MASEVDARGDDGLPAREPSRSASAARQRLAGTRFADVRWAATTGSTNSDLMALARDGAPEGLVLVADHQRRGRGRQGRQWIAPPGASLLVSVLLRPPAPLAGSVTVAVSVALAEAVEQVTGTSPKLKWPNDLLVGERKLAGVLAEADWPAGVTASGGWRAPAAHDRLAVVVGAGVNVNWPWPFRRDERGEEVPGVPPEVTERAVALNRLVGRDVDRVDLLVAYLRRLDGHYGQLVRDQSPVELLDAWRARSATLGRRVRVDLGTTDVDGTAVDITDEGHLVVETDGGERRTFAVGDVVHLRAVQP